MALVCENVGKKVIATIIETEGDCFIGMKQGDQFELSIHKCGDFCSYLYASPKNNAFLQTPRYKLEATA